MSRILTIILLFTSYLAVAQTQSSAISKKATDGKLALTDRGVEYFINLSMACVARDTPHYNPQAIKESDQATYKIAKNDWPAFYGCFDWHSAVHNHWTLIKLLKQYPKNRLAPGIVARLEESFEPEKLAAELKYFKINELQMFEFPYGSSWVLKIAQELSTWNDPKAAKWLTNLTPLVNQIVENYKFYWPKLKEPVLEGSHNNYAFGLSFGIDYARAVKNDSLETTLVKVAKYYYDTLKNYAFEKEPIGYDFMSPGLTIAELMRKVYPQKKYEEWLKRFAPKLLIATEAKKLLNVVRQKKHTGFESHWDGYQLNRIWCLNGIMKSVSDRFLDPNTKRQWLASQEQMWNYAQESIGKGNYDIDHCLSTFSVFALEGHK